MTISIDMMKRIMFLVRVELLILNSELSRWRIKYLSFRISTVDSFFIYLFTINIWGFFDFGIVSAIETTNLYTVSPMIIIRDRNVVHHDLSGAHVGDGS